ncbi:hypothetical protein [Photobacterium gaetbulicola]|uniref:hypothetical protein n=1 Tax=Photobacterium gaetbulicola TaxID=1295392 RepID=UPI001E3FA4DD|nr:hypothetical protein [Photobacterium gaetbulicola]
MGQTAFHQLTGIGVFAHLLGMGEQDKGMRTTQRGLGMTDAVVVKAAARAGCGHDGWFGQWVMPRSVA